MQLTLLSRGYCHLCHEMEQAVRAQLPTDWQLEVVDIDRHPVLEEKYDVLVPVLLAGEVVVFHYHFDPLRWQALTQAQKGPQALVKVG